MEPQTESTVGAGSRKRHTPGEKLARTAIRVLAWYHADLTQDQETAQLAERIIKDIGGMQYAAYTSRQTVETEINTKAWGYFLAEGPKYVRKVEALLRNQEERLAEVGREMAARQQAEEEREREEAAQQIESDRAEATRQTELQKAEWQRQAEHDALQAMKEAEEREQAENERRQVEQRAWQEKREQEEQEEEVRRLERLEAEQMEVLRASDTSMQSPENTERSMVRSRMSSQAGSQMALVTTTSRAEFQMVRHRPSSRVESQMALDIASPQSESQMMIDEREELRQEQYQWDGRTEGQS